MGDKPQTVFRKTKASFLADSFFQIFSSTPFTVMFDFCLEEYGTLFTFQQISRMLRKTCASSSFCCQRTFYCCGEGLGAWEIAWISWFLPSSRAPLHPWLLDGQKEEDLDIEDHPQTQILQQIFWNWTGWIFQCLKWSSIYDYMFKYLRFFWIYLCW